MTPKTVIGSAGTALALALVLATGAAGQETGRRKGTNARVQAAAPDGGSLGGLQVVTSAQIAAAGAPDVKTALALAAGVLIDDSGGPGGVATVSLRGSGSSQVLVLVDGRRLGDAQTPFVDLNDVPVTIERVERIEVIPPPASARYGADAVGGVVNVVTRPVGLKPALALSLGIGADAERRLAGGAQFGVGKLGLRADGQLRSGDGFRDNGDFDVKNASAALAVATDPWGLDVRWSTLERDAGDPGAETLPTPHARRSHDRDEVRAELSYRPGERWGVSAGGFSRQVSVGLEDPDPPEAESAPAAEPVARSTEGDSRGVEARLDFDTGAGEQFTVGGEYVEDRVGRDDEEDRETDRWGVFAQDRWRSGNWSAVGAVRRDEDSVYGERTAFSLAGGWEADGWAFSASWGRAERVPGFDELYRDEASSQGNPDLLPETSDSYEATAQYGAAGGSVRLVAFRRSVSDLIRWADADGDAVYRAENLADATFQGWEAEAVYRASASVEIPLSYQSLSAEDDDTGERLVGSVRSLWRAGIRGTGSAFTWSVDYTATDRGSFQHRDGDWSYAVLNAALAWRHAFDSFRVQAGVRAENIRDEEYETVEGYPQNGRAWFAEVRVEL